MRNFFARNITTTGRVIRALMGTALLGGAALAWQASGWLAGVLAAAGVFGLIEAARGWCLARACGIRTRF